jgi:3-oxoacyl-[acyl-carrier protein] reductase
MVVVTAALDRSFEGRVAVVTGAAGAIGSAAAGMLGRRGAALCLADIGPSPKTLEAVRQATDAVIDVPTDVTRVEAVRSLMDAACARFGRIDVLVNVAGVQSLGNAATLSEQEWDRVLAINLKGTFLCCQAVIAPMRRKGYGRIVNIGSLLGKNGGNARPWLDPGEQSGSANVAYGASKAAVHALTVYLAKELASQGITVNAVAPGPVQSVMTESFPERLRQLIPVGRMGTAEETAHAIAFLASECSGFITGEILDVNGGMWGD